MKTFKQFNKEAHYHLQEVAGDNIGVPFVGPLVRAGAWGLKQLAKPVVYRTLGVMDTARQLHKDIKNKNTVKNTLTNLAGNVGLTFAPWHKGWGVMKSKRFGLGMGGAMLGGDKDNNK